LFYVVIIHLKVSQDNEVYWSTELISAIKIYPLRHPEVLRIVPEREGQEAID